MKSNRNDLHNELIKTIHKKQNDNFTKSGPGGKTVSYNVYINNRSSSQDVQEWLKSKTFSRKYVLL